MFELQNKETALPPSPLSKITVLEFERPKNRFN